MCQFLCSFKAIQSTKVELGCMAHLVLKPIKSSILWFRREVIWSFLGGVMIFFVEGDDNFNLFGGFLREGSLSSKSQLTGIRQGTKLVLDRWYVNGRYQTKSNYL